MKARHEDIVGRYMYITYEGREYRVYYEEVGNKDGIPLILGHSASADGREYRFLMNDPDVCKDFYMVAFDLPYHGKSLPPFGHPWWAETYTMDTKKMCDWANMISDALECKDPVYMGMSMGGHLAIDLALYHPDKWSATIGLEGSLRTCQDYERYDKRMGGDRDLFRLEYDNPKVGRGQGGARMQENFAPLAAEEVQHEIYWIYNQAGPGIFAGDVDYFTGYLPGTHNVTEEQAKSIDTSKCMLYLLTGSYDPCNSPADTKKAADLIKGCYFRELENMGHFPAHEDYPAFKTYLMPILEDIKVRRTAK